MTTDMAQLNNAAILEPDNWFVDYSDQEEPEDQHIPEYELTATPNDFNIATIVSFIDLGAFEIPGFQRNYVWNINRASRLIESLILGLPVPQIFLFERDRDKFLVIDGQQRLMSIYYFVKERFPRMDKRIAIRNAFDAKGAIPESMLENDEYFTNFRLALPENLPNQKNRFKGLTHSSLADYRTRFDLRPIRNVVVRQNNRDGDDSAVYEIFERLNSGGVNLRPQEIRSSLYHSDFYAMLNGINSSQDWRRLVGNPVPDLHLKDLEIILRGFAMLVECETYAPSMVKFLNMFSKKAQSHDSEQNRYLKDLFASFLASASQLPDSAFLVSESSRFNIALFESVFVAACAPAFADRSLVAGDISADSIEALRNDPEFLQAARVGTTQRANVRKRLNRASAIIAVNGG